MPTTRGWAALGAGIALSLLWVAFGERLLLAVSAFLLIGVGIGIAYVRVAVPRVRITRLLTPFQVHDGDRAVVEVTLVSRRRIYQVGVQDEVHGLGAANFVADRVESRDPMVARYEILCRPRGVYRVGPASVSVRDPLGLTESGGTSGAADRLVVFPAVEDLDGLPLGRGQDPTVNTSRANFSQSGGEDFFTLREYTQGDDMRKVHWPSSAKRDELMIRQLEVPWQSRALILVDPRRAGHATPESYEHMVRGAASVLRHLFGKGYTPTLWTAAAHEILVASTEAYTIAMEQLATVQPAESLDLRSSVARLRRDGMAGGVLVLCTGVPDDDAVAAYRLLGRDFYRTVVMSVADDESEAILRFTRAGATTVTAGPTQPWAPMWKDGMDAVWSTATAG